MTGPGRSAIVESERERFDRRRSQYDPKPPVEIPESWLSTWGKLTLAIHPHPVPPWRAATPQRLGSPSLRASQDVLGCSR